MELKTTKKEYKQMKVISYPEQWRAIRLGNVITYIKGNKPLKMASENNGNYLPYLSAEYLRENKPIKFVDDSKGTIIVNDGDLILLWDGSNAGEFFLGRNGILSSTMVKLEITKELYDNKFLFYLLKQRELYLKGQTKGTGIPHVDGSVLSDLFIPLPPILEQRKIAEILSTVDSSIENVGKAIERTERLKNSLMKKLFSHGIGHKEFRTSEIGILPKEWNILSLKRVLKLCQYGLSIKILSEGRYNIVKMDDIADGLVVPDNVKYVNLDEKIFTNFMLEKGDILFNRTNSYELVGRTGIFLLDGDYVFASYLIRLRPNHRIINPTFLTSYLIYSNKRLKKLATRAVHQANINAANLQRFKLPLPHLSEQKKIVDILSTIRNRIELLKKRKKRLERIKKGLMNELLTGKKRVKVEA